MRYVLWEILFPLLLSAAAGLTLGWLLWRWRRRRVDHVEWESIQARAGQLEGVRTDLQRLQDEVAALTEERMTLRRRLRAQSADLKGFRSRATEAGGKVVELRTDLDEATTRVQVMQSEAEQAKARTMALSKEVDHANARVATISTDLEAANTRAASLEADLQEAVHRNAELVEELREREGDVRSEVVQLRADLAASRARVAELEAVVGHPTSAADIDLRDASGRHARRDDLKSIRGIGPKTEQVLHDHGIQTFRQLAELDRDGVEELEAALADPTGRIHRDEWVSQAKALYEQHHGAESERVTPHP